MPAIVSPHSIPTWSLACPVVGHFIKEQTVVQKVRICIVLDRSGSMEDCRSDAIGAVNSYLRQVKADKELDARISLMLFDSQSIDVIRDQAPAASCAELAKEEYQPRAATPLLDAVGHGVMLLDKGDRPNERCILAVMTDGLENASREYSKEAIKALLDRKQKEDGWLVLYLGAGHDAWTQARMLGLHAGNVANFAKSALAHSMQALGTRARRYAMAAEPKAEAASGGFTDEERAGMRDDKSKR
jgi:hypothetical protein